MSGDDNELMLVSSLDQDLSVDHSDMLEWVESLINQAISENNIHIAYSGLARLKKFAQVSGIGLAFGMYLIQKNWEKFGIEGSFEDEAYIHLGVARHTVERYVKVWKMYADSLIPGEFVDQIQKFNIGNQIPIANALAQGVEIEEAHWEKLTQAPDGYEIRRIIREDVKQAPPRKGSLQLFLTDEGQIKAFYNGDFFIVGWLNVSNTDEPIQKAIERIVSNGGILKR